MYVIEIKQNNQKIMYFKNRRSLQLSMRMVELILSVCRKLLPLKCLLGVKLYILIYGVHYLLLVNRQNMLLTQATELKIVKY